MSHFFPIADIRSLFDYFICAGQRPGPAFGTCQSALAVVRLMTSSNFVGCSTGISPGFVPRKILST